MKDLARPIPRPTARVAAYVEVLGAELTVQFLLTYGGAELYLANDPKGRASHEALLGYDKAKALAANPRLQMSHRIPLAKKWLVQMMSWQGCSTAHIARTVRPTDTTVRRWLKEQNG